MTFVAATAVQAGTNAAVGCGDVLTSSVTLTADLSCPGDGLTVGADDVTVNLGGHTLSGGGTGFSTGVSVIGHKGVTVRNGTVTGFGDAGVRAAQGATVTLSRVRATGTRLVGEYDGSMTVTGSPATCLMDGGYFRFTTLTVDHCTVRGSITTIVERVSVRSSRLGDGGSLMLSSAQDGVFTGNVFDDFSVTLGADSSNNLFSDNVFRNSYAPLWVDKTDHTPNTIENNVFRNNGIGLVSGNRFHNLIVRGNLFADNSTAGMLIENSSPTPNPYPIADNILRHNGYAPNGQTDHGGNPVQGGIHVFTYTVPKGPAPGPDPDPAAPIPLARNTGRGNGGFLIWGKQGQVVDGGGNQGPCGPQPGTGLVCR
ncbi:right-handed parallel beta-helix repeat-containing protein [Streptosporangium sp. NPDC051022]|uniref:right-handed parallel beta-helix repeat-containing protein n=1 Tax=Streptosporangium sp. NPDC051022 TaxID=3155752 RepID=UPI00344310C4